jgi:putative ABC transport system permease protein
MPERSWAVRLGRLLPADIERDLYTPALHDLNAENRSRVGYAIGVVALLLESYRLALVDHLTCPSLPGNSSSASGGKELFAMFRRDVVHALRLFVREPGFTATVVLTLALGIGANTALFAIVEAVLLRPLPYADAGTLAMVRHRDTRTGITKEFIAIGDFVDLRTRQRGLASFAGYGGFNSTFIGEGDPLRVEGLVATSELFDVLDVKPRLGRMFEARDVRPGAAPVVVISHRLWETQFGSDPNVVGRSMQLGATRRQVIGVAPRGFQFPPHQPTDVIVPQPLPPDAPAQRKNGWIFGVGRLAPGATIESVTAELDHLAQQFEREHPQQNQGSRYYALSLRDALVGDTKRPLMVLLGAVGFVLLMACVNVGNLLLARALARHTEMSLRLALGAGRFNLIAQVLTEGLVLAIAGALVGLLVAWRAVPAVAALAPRATLLPGLADAGINSLVLYFALGAAVLSALLFSGAACVGITHNAGRGALAAERRTSMSTTARRAASALVITEVALALVLLIGAGLTLRSFSNLISVDPGFRAHGVLTMQVQLPPGRYQSVDARRAVYDRMFAALEALPEIEAIGAGVVTPLTGNNWTVPFERLDRPVPQGERPPDVGWQAASGGFFRTLGIPLRAGRFFDARDTSSTPTVVIISEGVQRLYFGNENPIGRQVRLGPKSTAEIVGVVGDIRRAALSDIPRADMYFPFEQQPAANTGLFLRVLGESERAVPAVRATLGGIEPDLALYGVRSLDAIAAESAAVSNLAMRVLGAFAGLALALAAVGIYGVMSYSVRRRTRELGTRLALGATRRSISALVLRRAAILAAGGVGAGLVIGLTAARALGSLLYGVTPWDPVTIAGASLLLALTALAASYLPARRAASIDPVRTLTID